MVRVGLVERCSQLKEHGDFCHGAVVSRLTQKKVLHQFIIRAVIQRDMT